VKDKVAGTVLVEGMINEELYQNAHVSCQSNLSVKESLH
jgi:hypothetical protein